MDRPNSRFEVTPLRVRGAGHHRQAFGQLNEAREDERSDDEEH
jgi:hypothetical protein